MLATPVGIQRKLERHNELRSLAVRCLRKAIEMDDKGDDLGVKCALLEGRLLVREMDDLWVTL